MVAWRRYGSCAAALLLAGLAAQAGGQGTTTAPGPRAGAEVVEAVIAVVGGKPVLRSDLDDRFALLAPQFEIDPGDTSRANQLRREILDNLVSEQLLLQEAEAEGLKADQEQIDQAVNAAIEGDKQRLGPDGYAADLAEEGVTEAERRARYADEARKELLRRKLLEREVVAKVTVTDAQVEQYFRENKEKIGKRPRALRVLDLFVRTRPDTLIDATYRKRAEEIRQEIDRGLSFADAAARYSDDERSREDGGLLGRFGPGDLGDRTFEGAAFTGAIGAVVGPIRTNLGYHLIQVVDRDPQGAWVQIRHILIAVSPSRSDEMRARQRIESIRSEIVGGGLDFVEAVRRHSDDIASREAGGDVGWLPIDNFLGDTRGAIDSLRVGQVSRVAAVEGGFHLFKLVGEQAETDYNLDEIREDLRGVVEGQERQKRLDTYLAELRKKIYVEIRPL